MMLALPVLAAAAPGDLDPSFNQDGIDVVDFPAAAGFASAPDEVRAVVTQPDGKVIVAGYANILGDDDFALARYNPDGSLDAGFGFGGLQATHFGGNERATALLLQPDGRIVAAGFTDRDGDLDFALARYNPDGGLDSSFGGDGGTCCFFFQNDGARALALQPDGKIIAAGVTDRDGDLDVALMRFNPDGSLDSGFGNGGHACCFFFGDDAARALVLQPDGRLVIAGVTNEAGHQDFAISRYLADGTLDPSFGGGGLRISIDTDRQDEANALVLQPDGKLVTAGFSSDGVESDLALVRQNPDGSLDTGFGFGGGVLTSFGPGSFDVPLALLRQSDGKLVEAGTSLFFGADVDGDGAPDGDIDFAVVRHHGDGSLDTGFGFGGGTLTLFSPGSVDIAFGLAAQPDGQLVAAGTSIVPGDPASFNFAVARYDGGLTGRSTDRLGARANLRCQGRVVTIRGTSGNDRLRGTNGADVIHGLAGNDLISGFDGNDIVCGGRGRDRLLGGNGRDRLFGDGADDRLYGEKGRDTLDGGPGRDVCNPGKGGKSGPVCEVIDRRPPPARDRLTPPPAKPFRLGTVGPAVSNSPSRGPARTWRARTLVRKIDHP
jgi:uncharacterized delta-60 repeat protein